MQQFPKRRRAAYLRYTLQPTHDLARRSCERLLLLAGMVMGADSLGVSWSDSPIRNDLKLDSPLAPKKGLNLPTFVKAGEAG